MRATLAGDDATCDPPGDRAGAADARVAGAAGRLVEAGYWIDEGIAVGIASHDLADIPGILAQDGNPPLYYLLLHGWMLVFGAGEAATRALSLVFALAAVPASFWAGSALFDRRAGALAAAGAAGAPFLTYYAQETRMYSLVVLLSVLASASFALAFVRGRRAHVVWLGVWLGLLLYTHTWGLFLAAAMAVAWIVLWRRGDVTAPDGVKLGDRARRALRAVAAERALPGREHRRPVGGAPSPLLLLGVPGSLFGWVALPLLAIAVFFALRHRPPVDRAVRVLAAIGALTASMAWLVSQVEPAWASRYLAVVMGPLLLALAAVVSRGARWGALALVGVAVVWLVSGPPAVKSNVRTVSTGIAPQVRPGRPRRLHPARAGAGAVPLPAGRRRLPDADGAREDPRQTDWRDGLERLRAGRPRASCCPRSSGSSAGGGC